MPVLSETSFIQRIDFLKEDLSKEKPKYIDRLKEKGVECSILVPLFEILLGFDALKDIEYEFTSDKRFERFDFLIENRFIVEAKRLNYPLVDSKITDQIEKYILHHDNINYGVLSNGIEFAFFISKCFIEEFLEPEEKLKIDFNKAVFHVFTLSMDDEMFFNVIKLFSKDTYHEMFSRIAKFVKTRINNTRATKIADEKDLNTWLQNKISETMDVRRGRYFKDIQSGKYKPGDKLEYNDGNIKITVILEIDGRVRLEKGAAEIKDLMPVLDSEFSPMIDLVRSDWRNRDIIFNDTDEIMKEATGKGRLRKGAFVFEKI